MSTMPTCLRQRMSLESMSQIIDYFHHKTKFGHKIVCTDIDKGVITKTLCNGCLGHCGSYGPVLPDTSGHEDTDSGPLFIFSDIYPPLDLLSVSKLFSHVWKVFLHLSSLLLPIQFLNCHCTH